MYDEDCPPEGEQADHLVIDDSITSYSGENES
jgi:hypothetical protein